MVRFRHLVGSIAGGSEIFAWMHVSAITASVVRLILKALLVTPFLWRPLQEATAQDITLVGTDTTKK